MIANDEIYIYIYIYIEVHIFSSVAVSRFHTVPSFGPPLPAGATFTKGKSFASFLLAKVINGELATLRSEKFVALATRTRHEYLKDLVTNHSSSQPLEQTNKFCELPIMTVRSR